MVSKRININMPLTAETTAENKQVMAQTAESRKMEIQLVLVRIMKARKVRFSLSSVDFNRRPLIILFSATLLDSPAATTHS